MDGKSELVVILDTPTAYLDGLTLREFLDTVASAEIHINTDEGEKEVILL